MCCWLSSTSGMLLISHMWGHRFKSEKCLWMSIPLNITLSQAIGSVMYYCWLYSSTLLNAAITPMRDRFKLPHLKTKKKIMWFLKYKY